MVNLNPTRASALAAVYREGTYGAAGPAPGVVIAERSNLNLWMLRGTSVIGMALPAAPGTTHTSEACSALCLAPDEWLVSSTAANAPTPTSVDVSHGRTVLRISGPRTRDLLGKGCGIDLHPSVFLPGRCAQTAIARINVLMHLRDQAGTFDLYVSRSYAVSFWRWVTTSVAEFGYRVAAPLLETP